MPISPLKGLALLWPFVKELILGDCDLPKEARRNKIATTSMLLAAFFFLAALWMGDNALRVTDLNETCARKLEVASAELVHLRNRERSKVAHVEELKSRLRRIDDELSVYEEKLTTLKKRNQTLEDKLSSARSTIRSLKDRDTGELDEDRRKALEETLDYKPEGE